MPHKHKRDKTLDKNLYELPPTVRAKSLPVTKFTKGATTNVDSSKKPALKRKRSNKDTFQDDTPRAFSRLMAFAQGKKLPPSLDDGIVKSKKKRKTAPAPAATGLQPTPIASAENVPPLQIKPGERMNDFSARVDQALPVLGLIGKGTKGVKDLPGVKKHKTKHEKRMHKMYDEWRAVEAKRKEALAEAKEEAEDEEDIWAGVTTKSKKGKRRRNDGGSDDEDPWAALGAKRQEGKGLVGLHNVVQAPPQFTKIPREKFRVLDGARVNVGDVPNRVGSLRRREELGVARASVVEGYRKMMREKKSGGLG